MLRLRIRSKISSLPSGRRPRAALGRGRPGISQDGATPWQWGSGRRGEAAPSRLPGLVARAVTAALLVIGALSADPGWARTVGSLELAPCHLDNYRQEVLCGTHSVFEDRAAGTGRQIEIHFALLPAVGESPEPDPVVVFAGGPGQSARSMARFVSVVFSEVLEKRSVILIDQRGMGASHPLECELPEEDLSIGFEAQLALARELVTECLASWDADVTRYTQDLANEDIHEIVSALGFERANLFGASWGTRSALLYAHRYPEQTRTVVLDGALPLENTAPLYAAADADRALRALFADCAADGACARAFPELEESFHRAMARLEEEVELTVTDPTTGESQSLMFSAAAMGAMIRGILYAPELSRGLPLIIDRAGEGDYRPLFGVAAFLAGQTGGTMTTGASLAIFCAEELSRIEQDAAAAESMLLGRAFFTGLQNACSVWPETSVPAIYSEQVRSEAPALILSGAVDPITPPRWGEKISQALPNGLHLEATDTGHNVAPNGCAPELIAQFIDQGTAEGVDGGCLAEIRRPSFFIDAAGPVSEILEGGAER